MAALSIELPFYLSSSPDMKTRFYYIVEIQYLGFRYHGWQKQPNVITVQEMVLKTLNWVLPETASKVLASGRTDAKVSVNHTYIEVFTDKKIDDLVCFLEEFNKIFQQILKLYSLKPTMQKSIIIN